MDRLVEDLLRLPTGDWPNHVRQSTLKLDFKGAQKIEKSITRQLRILDEQGAALDNLKVLAPALVALYFGEGPIATGRIWWQFRPSAFTESSRAGLLDLMLQLKEVASSVNREDFVSSIQSWVSFVAAYNQAIKDVDILTRIFERYGSYTVARLVLASCDYRFAFDSGLPNRSAGTVKMNDVRNTSKEQLASAASTVVYYANRFKPLSPNDGQLSDNETIDAAGRAYDSIPLPIWRRNQRVPSKR